MTSVRVERLNDIGHDDACAEGIPSERGGKFACIGRFSELWDSINAKRAPWASNPWVWVVEFKRAG